MSDAKQQAIADVEWWREWGKQFGWTLYGTGGFGEGNRGSATFYDTAQTFHKVTGAIRASFDAQLSAARAEAEQARVNIDRANRIIGWMMPYIGNMCPPDGGLGELNLHCCDNKVPDYSRRKDIQGKPINQANIRAISATTPKGEE